MTEEQIISICDAHGIPLPPECIEQVVEIVRLATAPTAAQPQIVSPVCPRPCRYAYSVDYTQIAAPSAAEKVTADAGSDRPHDDAIARSKRILAMVDTYHERPDRMNRNALRSYLMDEFTELLAQPSEAQTADVDLASLEAWILRAQVSLRDGQPGPARVELEKALQVLHAGVQS